MADPLPDPEAGTPRWVKAAGVVAVVVVVLIVIAVVTGLHDGPSRHDGANGETPYDALER